MTSPATRRINVAQAAPAGHIVPSGVEEFKRCIKGPDASAAFYAWRSSPFARKMYLALQDLMIHQPVETRDENVLVQYGVTQGLAIAMQMLVDPSVLWPGVFGEGTPGYVPDEPEREPPMDFSTPADAVMEL